MNRCPPSFDTVVPRLGSTSGPCDGDLATAFVTDVNAGDRLKVGWPSGNRAGGYIRLALGMIISRSFIQSPRSSS